MVALALATSSARVVWCNLGVRGTISRAAVVACPASCDPAKASRVRTAATYAGDPHGDKEAPPFLKKRDHVSKTADGIPLPRGWVEIRSPSRGIYYHHKASGVTQWDFPKADPSKEQLKEAYHERVGSKIAELHPGAQVQFVGLQFQPQLNGKSGVCEGWDHSSNMIRVRLQSGQLKAVKPDNLRVVQATASRKKAQKPADGRSKDTGQAGGSWASKNLVLGLLGGGAVAWWAVWYGLLLLDPPKKPAPSQAIEEASAKGGTPSPPPLPAGWRETLDPNSGKAYYWREDNPAGTTTWERPLA